MACEGDFERVLTAKDLKGVPLLLLASKKQVLSGSRSLARQGDWYPTGCPTYTRSEIVSRRSRSSAVEEAECYMRA